MDRERRKSRRFNVFLNAGIISDNTFYKGFAGNLSVNGLYVRISSAKSSIMFADRINVYLRPLSDRDGELDLYCRRIWSYEIPQDSSKGISAYNMGMKILDLSDDYNTFYRNLAVENLNEYIKRL